ncbi:GbsR/MarR family transcriptional regulator [Devosia honganensis]|uniref:GbsR/MarR family transcriptional regulator n=1 Tax=Devosia honganensis TaxID=1610527 RepID=A0ABV7WWP5_9HYPH
MKISSVDRFIEEMGLIAQEAGESRISGRIVGLLIVEDREFSLAQISERLGISRASVSTNARMLARRGVIRRTAHAGDRQDYYELSALPFADRLEEIAGQFARHARTIGNCLEGMRHENTAMTDRVKSVQSFFEQSSHILKGWANSLEHETASREDGQ